MTFPTVEQLGAIAELWKLVTPVLVFILLLLYRRDVRNFAARLGAARLKRGSTEFEIEAHKPESTPPALPSPEATAEPQPQGDESVTPAEEPADWFDALFIHRDGDAASRLFVDAQRRESDEEERDRNEAVYWSLRFRTLTDMNALPALERLSQDSKVKAYATSCLARAYERIGDLNRAERLWTQAVATAGAGGEKATYVAGAAECLLKMGDDRGALALLMSELQHTADPKMQAVLYKTIAELEEGSGGVIIRAAVLEKVAELRSGDDDALFAAAYAEGDTKLKRVALVNYDGLLRLKHDHPNAANNLGVACRELGMPIKSISLFERAAARGESLAMANLAFRFMGEGFENPAKELLARANQMPDPHPNVVRATAELASRNSQEEEAWSRAVREGERQRVFLRAFAEARYHTSPADGLDGMWESSSGERITIKADGGTVSFEWVLGGERWQFQGKRTNRSAVGAVAKWGKEIWMTKEDFIRPVEALLSSDAVTLRMMTVDDNAPQFWSFRRSSGVAITSEA